MFVVLLVVVLFRVLVWAVFWAVLVVIVGRVNVYLGMVWRLVLVVEWLMIYWAGYVMYWLLVVVPLCCGVVV